MTRDELGLCMCRQVGYRPAIAAPPARSGLADTLGGRPAAPYPRGLSARPGGSRLDARLPGVIGLPLGLGARNGVPALPLGLGARKGVSARPAGLGARSLLRRPTSHDGVRCRGGRGSCGDPPICGLGDPPICGRRLAEDGLSAAPDLRGRTFALCSSLESQVFGFKSMMIFPRGSLLRT